MSKWLVENVVFSDFVNTYLNHSTREMSSPKANSKLFVAFLSCRWLIPLGSLEIEWEHQLRPGKKRSQSLQRRPPQKTNRKSPSWFGIPKRRKRTLWGASQHDCEIPFGSSPKGSSETWGLFSRFNKSKPKASWLSSINLFFKRPQPKMEWPEQPWLQSKLARQSKPNPLERQVVALSSFLFNSGIVILVLWTKNGKKEPRALCLLPFLLLGKKQPKPSWGLPSQKCSTPLPFQGEKQKK